MSPRSPKIQSAVVAASRLPALFLLLMLAAPLAPAGAAVAGAQSAPPGEPAGMAGGTGAMGAMGHGAHADHAQTADAEQNPSVQRGANDSMSHEQMDMGAHMKMTSPRQPAPKDQEKAAAIVKSLRAAIDKYRDYRVAVAEGYLQYLPNLKQSIYHFTNWGRGYQEAFTFDPAQPTSLLYKKTGDGFQLLGAMYTAPKEMAEDRLDERVPLSVASWHQHVNICLPPKERYASADWTKFGFAGSIATAADCAAAGGQFHPVIFGWMVHVYPFETDPGKIWAH
ncbi:MAG TPA: hypothetical protein VHR45_23575 [Thermoanaerobaculia bacterium]|nr:hypothetical protein [Thermoanaerobaculia bacterium]